MKDDRQHIVITLTNDMLYDQRMQRICKSLAKSYRVTVLSRRSYKTEYKTDEYKIIAFRPWFKSGFAFYLSMNLWFLYKLMSMSYEAINAVDLDSVLPAYIASRLKKKKIIYDAHEYYEETPEIINRSFVKWFWSRLAMSVLPRIKHNYTVNEALAVELNDKYSVSYQSIMNVPYANPIANNKESKKIILYQGVLNKGRGLESMIQAMSSIEFATLDIVGAGDIEEQLKELVLNLKLGHKVNFLGRKEPAELKYITPRAWLGINLLESKSKSYYLSLANKYFDYIQAGVPQLCMDFPVYKELNKSHEVAILLEDLSPELIANKIKELNQNKVQYDHLQDACTKAAKLYTWENEEPKLLKFYAEIL